jgi:hypothetical protein
LKLIEKLLRSWFFLEFLKILILWYLFVDILCKCRRTLVISFAYKSCSLFIDILIHIIDNAQIYLISFIQICFLMRIAATFSLKICLLNHSPLNISTLDHLANEMFQLIFIAYFFQRFRAFQQQMVFTSSHTNWFWMRKWIFKNFFFFFFFF